MMAESDGSMWLLTDHRAMKYSQGTWTDYLPQFNGTIIGMDSTHSVWVVSEDRVQVSVWDGSAWTSLGPEAGWEPPTLDNGMGLSWSVATDALGQLWLATDRDVRMFDGTRWKVFDLNDLGMPRPEEEDAFSETTIAFLKTSGYIWAINCYWVGPGPIGGGGARWYDGDVWQGSDSPVARGCATVINEDSLGNIWLGLDNDLWRLNTSLDSWKRFPTPEPLAGKKRLSFFTDLALDSIGNPWPELSVCGGAGCFAGNVRYHVTEGKWLQIGDVAADISSLYFDATGQGWVFGPEGVFLIAGAQLEPVAEISIRKVAVDPSGKLWIIGNYEGETVLWVNSR
jgi:ligand-binding sensor domain-containing protein